MPSQNKQSSQPPIKRPSTPSAGSLAKRQKTLFNFVNRLPSKVVGATTSAIVEDYGWRAVDKCLKSSAESERHKDLPTIFPNQDAFRAAYQQIELIFPATAPDLFQILTSTSPPSVDWIKSLEDFKDPDREFWAVCFCLLQKEEFGRTTYILYVDSGSDSTNKYFKRRRDYDQGKAIATRVQEALDQGFKIVHIAPVVLMRFPSPASRTTGKAVLGVLHATFAAMFGAIELKFGGSPLIGMSLWPHADLPWSGACQKNPLNDKKYFQKLGSAEDIITKEAEAKTKEKERFAQHQADLHQLLADKDPSMQCPKCGEFRYGIKAHVERCKGPKKKAVPKIAENQCKKCKKYLCDKWYKRDHEAKCKGIAHSSTAVDLSDEDDTNSDTDDDSDTNDDFAPAGKLNEEDFPEPSGDDAIATLASSSSKPNQPETIELSSDHDTPTKSNKRAALKMAAIVIDDDSDSDTPSIKASPSAQNADLLGFMATAEELIKSSNAQSLAGVDLSAFMVIARQLMQSDPAHEESRESEPKEPVKLEAFVKAKESITAKTTMKAEEPMEAPGVARGGVAKLRRGRGRKCKNKGVADTEDEADD